MANYNRIILAGNLTRDPELSYTPSNTPVCKFGLAVNRNWTDRQTNEQHKETMFIDCTAWSRRAEVINQYCRKGNPLLIEGRLVLDTWTNPEGQKRSRHTVNVDNFEFLGTAGGGAPDASSGEAPEASSDGAPRASSGAPRSEAAPAPAEAAPPEPPDGPGNVPF